MSPLSGSSRSVYRDQLVIPNRPADIARFENAFIERVGEMDYDDTSCFAVRLAVEECLRNAFLHGNGEDPDKSIFVDCRVDPRGVEIEIRDEGAGFDPVAVPDPTRDENIEIPTGRGLLLMRAYMTDVTIVPPGNMVFMRFVYPSR